MVTILSLVVLSATALGVCYHYVLAIGSALRRNPPARQPGRPRLRFLVAVAAHDEEAVIGDTVRALRGMVYPRALVEFHVVADHCGDGTAQKARAEGAIVHERREGPRSGKGAALAWLFRCLPLERYDVVAVFDADTHPDPGFLQAVEARVESGERVVQGQHIIGNAGSGWLPAFISAMFIIDNRFQNQGRSNLGWSAKNMGDSICIRADVLKEVGWGEGLTDDYDLRQRLLLRGIRICYAPEAKGFGEAAATFSAARAQRLRWLQGVRDSRRRHAPHLLVQSVRRRDGAMFEAWLQARVPSYSTLTVLAVAALALQAALLLGWPTVVPAALLAAWSWVAVALVIYPVLGLALEGAPASRYRALLCGPVFVVWRGWLAMSVRMGRGPDGWIRTPHGE